MGALYKFISFLTKVCPLHSYSVGELHFEFDNSSLEVEYLINVYQFSRELSLILKEIKIITDKIRDDEESAAIENDWKFAAMVLDRLCLIVFTLFTIVATVAVLAAAPHVIVT